MPAEHEESTHSLHFRGSNIFSMDNRHKQPPPIHPSLLIHSTCPLPFIKNEKQRQSRQTWDMSFHCTFFPPISTELQWQILILNKNPFPHGSSILTTKMSLQYICLGSQTPSNFLFKLFFFLIKSSCSKAEELLSKAKNHSGYIKEHSFCWNFVRISNEPWGSSKPNKK